MAHVMRSWLHFPPLPAGTAPLWAGVLGPPAAWAAQMETVYAFSTWSCWHHTRGLLYAANVILLLTAVAGGVLSLTYWRGRQEFGEQERRIMLLSGLGILSSIMYSTLIVAQLIAAIMLDPCAT
jgi:hypothetical protein